MPREDALKVTQHMLLELAGVEEEGFDCVQLIVEK
jgi:hypothetical protein